MDLQLHPNEFEYAIIIIFSLMSGACQCNMRFQIGFNNLPYDYECIHQSTGTPGKLCHLVNFRK